MSHWKLTIIIISLVLIGLIVGIIYQFNIPYVGYESSDRQWVEHESLLKGHDLEAIVFNFEKYKIKCRQSQVTLYRTTAKEFSNVLAWPNYLLDNKWKLPYHDASNLLPIVRYPQCTNDDYGNEPYEEIYQKVSVAKQEFLQQLAKRKRPNFFTK